MILFCNLCVYMYIRYVRSFAAQLEVVFMVRSESKQKDL